MSDQIQQFFDNLARKPKIVSGHVASVTYNATTGALEQATVLIGTQTLALSLDAFTPPLAIGDQVRLAQSGRDASAEYRLAGLESGARPASGFFPVLDDGVPLGGATYFGGDVILGKLNAGNIYIEYSTGRLYHRIGVTVNGIAYPDGSQLIGAAALEGGDWLPTGSNLHISAAGGLRIREGLELRGAFGDLAGLYAYAADKPIYGQAIGAYAPAQVWLGADPANGLRLMNWRTRVFQAFPDGSVVLGSEGQAEIRFEPQSGLLTFSSGGVIQSAIDAESRTIYGIERLGRPLGPAIEWEPLTDPSGDPALERMGFWVRDASERFFGLWSGNTVDPADAGMRIGAQGAAHYLEWRDGVLNIAGNITILNPGTANPVAWDDVTGKPGTLGTPGGEGLYLGAAQMGYYTGAAWTTYIDHHGNFYLGGAGGPLTWTAGTSTLKAGGWSINGTSIYTGTEDHSGYTANAGDMTLYSDGSAASIHAKNFYIDASGNLTATGATISGALTATSGTFSGTVNAAAGTFTGLVSIGATEAAHLHLDGAQALLESSNFASGATGWRIDSAGAAEFENITARGSIKTAVFEKSLITAFAGSQMVAKSASTLIAAVTLGAGTFTVDVKLQAAAAPFANGDLIYLKTSALATYATVDTGSATTGGWRYTATYTSGSSAGTIAIGETVIDFGGNGVGRLILSADQADTPYLGIATHNMDAAPVWTERARLGNLAGIAGASGYGLWTDNGFFTGTVNWGGGKGVLNATGLDYTYSAGDFVKIDAGAAADGILRVSGLGSTFANGINVAVDSASYALAASHTDCRLGGAYRATIEIGGSGGINSVGYGFAALLTRKADATAAGLMYGVYSQIASGVDDEVGYGFYANLALTGAGTPTAYTFYGTGGVISNSHGAVFNESGADSDTRIESDTEANMVLVDAGTDAVYLGGTTNGVKIAKGGVLTLEGTASTPFLNATGAVAGASGQVQTFTNGLIANEGGADSDTRIESDTEANMVLVDAGADAVYLGGSTNGIKIAKGGVLTLEGTASTPFLLATGATTGASSQVQTFTNGLIANEGGADSDTRIEGDTATNLLVCDAGLDAVQIGTATAGVIADFRAAAIVFNEDGADRDTRIESDTEANMVLVDAGTDAVYLGGSTNGIKVAKGGVLTAVGTGTVTNTPKGWLPFAWVEGFGPTESTGTDIDLAANGGTFAGLVVVGAPMLLESVSTFLKDTSSGRAWNWALYKQTTNTGDAAENTLARVAYGNAAEAFTPSVAAVHTIVANSAPVTLEPGAYWLCLQNTHATRTLKVGCAGVGGMGVNGIQIKTCANPIGATLDFVAATWTKYTYVFSGRLNGRVFGQTAAF